MNQILARKRIAILLPDLRGGGAERLHLHLAKEFLSRGYTVDFLLMLKRGELLDDLPDISRVIDLHAARIRNAFLPLVQYIRKERPDAIIVAMWPLTIIGILAHRISGHHGRILLRPKCISNHYYSKLYIVITNKLCE